MISRFFIDRPIFATVLSVVITLAGALAVFRLPLAQFPSVSPPTITVTCNYPGASAKDVSEAVAAPIEQQVNGVEGMMYMSSSCTNDGSYTLNVTFYHGIDIDMAQVMVQNRVSLAIPSLPDVIKQTGVTTRKQSPDIVMGLAVYSPNRRYDQLYLSNYSSLQIKDELARIDGVSDVMLFGQRDYSMRVWVDPEKLASRNMSASDVARAIREQNTQAVAGSIGQPPTPSAQQRQLTLSTLGRLTDVEQFEDIVIKSTHEGRQTKLKDVARIELGAKSRAVSVTMDGIETVFLAIFQTPDANALETRDRCLAKMEELKKSFPEGMDYDIGFDTTPYTRESIKEVFNTLGDAIVLVAFVVLLFLQNWRSTIIPLVAVPVAIVGTFAAMFLFGFSINNLTLFGLVLAIGIVVDDAIVVVEAVEHHIELGMSPRQATIAAMEQVSGPVIAVGLVLSAVFVPCAFISGITGQFFRQFALTISVSTIISAFNSLTLSPALAAVLLRRHDKTAAPPLPRLAFPLLTGVLAWEFGVGPITNFLATRRDQISPTVAHWLDTSGSWFVPTMIVVSAAIAGWLVGGWVNQLLGFFFRGFNRVFRVITTGYVKVVGQLLRVSMIVLLLYGGLLGVTWWRSKVTPTGFIPSQDMGYLLVNIQLPDSASNERTAEVVRQIVDIGMETKGIRHISGMVGQSFVLSAFGSNFGTMFVNLNPYPMRRSPELSSDAIANHLRGRLAQEVLGANVQVFGPPPVRGAGRAGGFMLMVEDRGDVGSKVLQEQTELLVGKGNQIPGLMNLFSVFRANVPQFNVDADVEQCLMRHVALQEFTETLRVYQGSLYVNDFNLFGRTWQVIVQADSEFRDNPEDVSRLKVRNQMGQMVPVGSLAGLRDMNGPLVLTRYNMYPSASINGSAAPGMSSAQALSSMQQLAARELPQNMAFEWTDMSYLELLAGNTATMIFMFAVAMVFLVLAAQYESWSLPMAVILVVPMCLLSALIGVNIARMDVNIFTRVGFVVLVGLASKNAILIVEFAKQQRLAGVDRHQATLEACRLRLRPIVMTSLAFILGVVPLLMARGAGAEMRRALGTPVFSGMVGVTLFGLLLTPVFFFTIDWLSESRLFASRFFRAFGGGLLTVVSPKPLWRAASGALARIQARRKVAKPSLPMPRVLPEVTPLKEASEYGDLMPGLTGSDRTGSDRLPDSSRSVSPLSTSQVSTTPVSTVPTSTSPTSTFPAPPKSKSFKPAPAADAAMTARSTEIAAEDNGSASVPTPHFVQPSADTGTGGASGIAGGPHIHRAATSGVEKVSAAEANGGMSNSGISNGGMPNGAVSNSTVSNGSPSKGQVESNGHDTNGHDTNGHGESNGQSANGESQGAEAKNGAGETNGAKTESHIAAPQQTETTVNVVATPPSSAPPNTIVVTSNPELKGLADSGEPVGQE